MTYIYIILAIAALGGIYFVYKVLMNRAPDIYKLVRLNPKDPEFAVLSDEEKENVLNVYIKFYKNNTEIQMPLAIEVVSFKTDVDKLLDSAKKIIKIDPTFDLAKLTKLMAANANVEEFIKAWNDQVNANVTIPYKTHLHHLQNNQSSIALVEIAITAIRSGVTIDIPLLVVNDFTDEKIKNLVHALIRAKKANIFQTEEERASLNLTNQKDYLLSYRITQKLLMELTKTQRDINLFVNTMIRAHEADLPLNLSMLDIFSINEKDFDAIVNNLIKAQKANIYIDQEDLIHQNISGASINKLVTAIITAKKANLEIEFHELMEYHVHTGADAHNYITALSLSKTFNLGFDKDDLIERSKKDNDLIDFINSVKLIRTLPELGITQAEIEKHFAAKGKVMHVLQAVINAGKMQLPLDFGLASQIDLHPELNLQMAMVWATEPHIVEVIPRITIVTKKGIQVIPKLNVTLRGKLDKILKGYRESILFARINDIIVSEVESFNTHEDVLNNLTLIAQNTLKKINGQILAEENTNLDSNPEKELSLNKFSAYEVLDISIYDLELGKDIKAELQKKQAEIEAQIHKIHAHADLVKAEADLRIAMVEQYKKGEKPNFNELHKDNLFKEKSTEDIRH